MIKARFIIEAVGSPKELVVKTLENIMNSIKEVFDVEDYVIGKPEKKSERMFMSFIELVVRFKNVQSLFGFMMYYTPSIVEILEPYKLDISAGELENISNDIMSKIHELDKRLKSVVGLNSMLSKRILHGNTDKKI